MPTVAFIAAVMLLSDDKFHYTTANLFLLNTMIGPAAWTDAWHFWFIEVLVYVLVGVSALLAIPWAHRAEKRFPLAFPVALVGAGAAVPLQPGAVRHPSHAAGPVALRPGLGDCPGPDVAPTPGPLHPGSADRCRASSTTPCAKPLFLAGILLVAWIPAIPLPTILHRAVGAVASASLYIYVTHWVVFPGLQGEPA